MIKEFYLMPPGERYLPSCEEICKKYLENSSLNTVAAIASAIVQRSSLLIQLTNANYEQQESLFGYNSKSKDDAMKFYLFERAATFKFTYVGGCSHRASYAAICLR